jgi:hypothetical protein
VVCRSEVTSADPASSPEQSLRPFLKPAAAMIARLSAQE